MENLPHRSVRKIQEIADPGSVSRVPAHFGDEHRPFSTAKGATAAERFVKLNPNRITI